MQTDAIIKRLADLADQKRLSEQAFVHSVVSVSTGALACSITFRSFITGPGVEHIWLLKLAWGCLCVCCVVGVFMERAMAEACKRFMAAMEKDENTIAERPHAIFEVLIWFLYIGFPAGMAALSAFGIMNVH